MESRVSLHVKTGKQKDIVEYVGSCSLGHANGKWWDEDQKLVIQTLSEKADGTCVSSCEKLIYFTEITAGSDGFSAN